MTARSRTASSSSTNADAVRGKCDPWREHRLVAGDWTRPARAVYTVRLVPTLLDRYGPIALVTGAASGIGKSFALALAREGFELVLVDRQRAPLEMVAAELGAEACSGDLVDRGFVAELRERCARDPIGLLIHAAGVSSMGRFLDLPLDALRREVDLHCATSLELTHAAASAMRERRRGGIVLLSSSSAVLRSPFVSNYAATKAYTLALAESLYDDLRESGVDVLALVPGMTRTALLEQARPNARAQKFMASPDDVAAAALRALGRAPVVMPSVSDRIATTLITRFLPQKLGRALARRSMIYFFDHLE